MTRPVAAAVALLAWNSPRLLHSSIIRLFSHYSVTVLTLTPLILSIRLFWSRQSPTLFIFRRLLFFIWAASRAGWPKLLSLSLPVLRGSFSAVEQFSMAILGSFILFLIECRDPSSKHKIFRACFFDRIHIFYNFQCSCSASWWVA